MTSAEALHKDTIIIDGVCPLLMEKANVDWYLDGGVTVAVPTVAIRELAEQTLRNLGAWLRFIETDNRLRLVRNSNDVQQAKASNQMGIVFHLQSQGCVRQCGCSTSVSASRLQGSSLHVVGGKSRRVRSDRVAGDGGVLPSAGGGPRGRRLLAAAPSADGRGKPAD